jgi:hypothetical protein
MTDIENFISRCDRYCEARGIKRTTLSGDVLLNAGRLQQLADGDLNIGFKTLQKAEERLSALESELASNKAAAQ